MGISGNLETMGLPEVLQWIATSRKTGTLYLRRGSTEKRIVFQHGTVYSSWSNHPRESLGQFLIRDRYVTEEQLFGALVRQEQNGQLLGGILVDDGILSPEDLRQALTTKAEETVYDLFLWPDGSFEFRDGDLPDLLHVDLPVTHVILEGIRRVDEWRRIRAVFPSSESTFRVRDGATGRNAAEVHALSLARAGRTLPQIALEMRRSEFDAASVLFGLHERGLVELGESAPSRRGGRDTVEVITQLLAEAEECARERRHAAAVGVYEQVLVMDHLNHRARKGLATAREALEAERLSRDLQILDRVPVIVMDLKELTREVLDPQEGFVLSRVNGTWDVRSILKICPIDEQEALQIFSRLYKRGVLELRGR
jgi:hypothetical protein